MADDCCVVGLKKRLGIPGLDAPVDGELEDPDVNCANAAANASCVILGDGVGILELSLLLGFVGIDHPPDGPVRLVPGLLEDA